MTKRRHSRRRHGGKHKRGGSSYSSAASYSEYVNGSEDAQYGRVFSQTGPYANIPGNISIGAQGQNANMAGMPSAQQLALVQKAGKRGSRRKRGGIWGSVINQAVVPFSLLGLQQSYRRRSPNNMHTRRRRYRR
jgi:hypothetical protein